MYTGNPGLGLNMSIDILSKRLMDESIENTGVWCGRQWMNVSLTAEYLLLLKYLHLEESERIIHALKEIENRQNRDGGFPAYIHGASEPSISVICQLALELYRDKANPEVLEKATAYVNSIGRHRKILLIARFYRFIFWKSTFKGLPQIRPELILWPRWTGVSVYNVASWVRSWLVPISVLWHYEKYNPERPDRTRFRFYSSYLRRKSLSIIKKWLLEHQEADGSWYGVFSSTMISLMALYRLGFSTGSEYIVKGINFIHSLQDKSDGTIRQQPFLGPIWDTALSTLALTENPVSHFPGSDKTKDFLLKNQNKSYGDWSVNNQCKPGGWSFEYVNQYYPDVDDTTAVLRALIRLGTPHSDAQLKRGLNWVLSMQNKNGSWSAFDKNNNGWLPNLYIKIRDYYIGEGPNLLLDAGTPDLTARVLESLATFNYSFNDLPVKRAIKWLRKTQKSDGSWFGRWGLCYLFGTSSVLCGLNAVGEDMTKKYIEKAIKFIYNHQNDDGGFGEVPESYFSLEKRGKGPSDPAQTAIVIIGLIAAGKHQSKNVEKGINYLNKNLNTNGLYDSVAYHAVAAPPFYHRYELLPVYYPLIALKQYSDKIN